MALTTLKVKHAGPGRHAECMDYICSYATAERGPGAPDAARRTAEGLWLGAGHDVPLADARILAADLRKAIRL